MRIWLTKLIGWFQIRRELRKFRHDIKQTDLSKERQRKLIGYYKQVMKDNLRELSEAAFEYDELNQ